MRVIIQCAAAKNQKAGSFTWNGKRVKFVAQPKMVPKNDSFLYCRPDDLIPSGEKTWREMLVKYNEVGSNPDGLLQAAFLYRPGVYNMLVQHFGLNNLYILSAGWGLVRATFLLPEYDITFSSVNDKWKKRGKKDCYRDFNHLAEDLEEQNNGAVVYLGGKGYFQLLQSLLESNQYDKFIFYRTEPGQRSNKEPALTIPSSTYVPFPTKTRTNWHYECAKSLIAGKIKIQPTN